MVVGVSWLIICRSVDLFVLDWLIMLIICGLLIEKEILLMVVFVLKVLVIF